LVPPTHSTKQRIKLLPDSSEVKVVFEESYAASIKMILIQKKKLFVLACKILFVSYMLQIFTDAISSSSTCVIYPLNVNNKVELLNGIHNNNCE